MPAGDEPPPPTLVDSGDNRPPALVRREFVVVSGASHATNPPEDLRNGVCAECRLLNRY